MRGPRRIAIITIGQAPRDDVVPDIEMVLESKAILMQRGALDDLDDDAIHALEPRSGDTVLATRLRSGREIRLAHQHITPLLANALERARTAGAESAVILCTGTFDRAALNGTIPLITADEALIHTATALAGTRNLLIVCPDSNQIPDMESRWNVIAPQTLVVAASPYGSRDVFALALASATTAANLQPDAWLAVLDCVGYDLEHQATVEQIVGLSAVVPRLAIAHLLSQIV